MLIWYLLKNSLKELILEKYQQTTKTQTTLPCMQKVYKCISELVIGVFLNIAVRCETAIKTNDPLYNHLQLGVGHNP